MSKNIILCGFMGCGKTTVGKNLQRRSGMNMIDTDAYIEKKQDMKKRGLASPDCADALALTFAGNVQAGTKQLPSAMLR